MQENEHRVPTQLYWTQTYEPQGEHLFTVCIIDDQHGTVNGFASALRSKGYRAIGYFIEAGLRANPIQQRALARTIEYSGVDLVISDKNLDSFDGIELISTLTHAGLRTIMLTAEAKTRETHQVAEEFMVKPILPSELVEKVDEIFGIVRDEEPEEDFGQWNDE